MNQAGSAIYVALLLILPLSALIARRLPLRVTIRMVLAWLAIFVICFLVVIAWRGATAAGSST